MLGRSSLKPVARGVRSVYSRPVCIQQTRLYTSAHHFKIFQGVLASAALSPCFTDPDAGQPCADGLGPRLRGADHLRVPGDPLLNELPGREQRRHRAGQLRVSPTPAP